MVEKVIFLMALLSLPYPCVKVIGFFYFSLLLGLKQRLPFSEFREKKLMSFVFRAERKRD